MIKDETGDIISQVLQISILPLQVTSESFSTQMFNLVL